jgi:hypothetical protein
VEAHEWNVARRFGRLLEQLRGVELSDPVEHDAIDETGLLVDCTFHGPGVTVAAELTSVRLSPHVKTAGASRRFAARLSAEVDGEDLGSFVVGVAGTASLNQLKGELLPLMKRMVEVGRQVFQPRSYTADELGAWPRESQRQRFEAELQRLTDLGLIEIEWKGRGENVVRVVTISDYAPAGLAQDLTKAIEENAAKLGQAREQTGAETHLVVVVDAHGDPHFTPVPKLPPQVDHLWLLLKFEIEPGRPKVWKAARGDRSWSPVAPAW